LGFTFIPMPSFTLPISLPLHIEDGHVCLQSSAYVLDGEVLVEAAERLIREQSPQEVVFLVGAEIQAMNVDRVLQDQLTQIRQDLMGGGQSAFEATKRLKQLLRNPLDAVSEDARRRAREVGRKWIERNYVFIMQLRCTFGIQIAIVEWLEFIEGAGEPVPAFLQYIVDAMCQSISLHAQWPGIVQAQLQQQHRIPHLKTIEFLHELHRDQDGRQALPKNLTEFLRAQDPSFQAQIHSALEGFQKLPGWTRDIFRQAYQFEERASRKGGGVSVDWVQHLVSQLYVFHETVFFVLAAQRNDTNAYHMYQYPAFPFQVVKSLGQTALSLEFATVVPSWTAFPKPKRSPLLALSRLLDTCHLGWAFSPRLDPLECCKQGVESSPLLVVEWDGAMAQLYHSILGERCLEPQPLSDSDIFCFRPLAKIFEEHDKIAVLEGSWSGHEPVFTCQGAMLVFLDCKVEKKAEVVDGIVNLRCSSTPLDDKLRPVTHLSQFAHLAPEAPAGFTLGFTAYDQDPPDQHEAAEARRSRHSARARTRQREKVRRSVRTPSP